MKKQKRKYKLEINLCQITNRSKITANKGNRGLNAATVQHFIVSNHKNGKNKNENGELNKK